MFLRLFAGHNFSTVRKYFFNAGEAVENNLNFLFAGDSITDWFDTAELLKSYKIKNVGVAGDSTAELAERINHSWFEPLPDYIFLCIGTNDLARKRSPEEIRDKILDVCTKLSNYAKSSKIVLTTVFPVRNNPDRIMQDIIQLNELIDNAALNNGYLYFNLFPNFTDEAGMLKEKFTDDGLHLTKAAYVRWAELFEVFVKGLKK